MSFGSLLFLLALPAFVTPAAPAGVHEKPAGNGREERNEGWSDYGLSGPGNRGMVVAPRARYPKGCNCTGVVRFRFTVMPDGTITGISLVHSSAPELVKAAKKGLRKGRFRPLHADLPQEPQPAIITYRFYLEFPGHREEIGGGG